jgi:predicted amidohydrolase
MAMSPADGEPTAGIVRVLLAAVRCEKGDMAANLAMHRRVLAASWGCQLAIFPEMSLTGSLDPRTAPGALATLDAAPVRALAQATGQHAVAAVFGIAERGAGGASHITQVYACGGKIAGVYRKRHLGEGEEGYTPGRESALFRLGKGPGERPGEGPGLIEPEVSFGIAICAEGSVDYPFDEPAAAGARLIAFCAAPGLYGRRTDEASWRAGHAWWQGCGLGDARRHAARTGTWVALATQAGSTADEDFPGLAAFVSPAGQVTARLPDWRAGTLVADLPLGPAFWRRHGGSRIR